MSRDKFSKKEMDRIVKLLSAKYKNLSEKTSIPYASLYRISSIGNLIFFAYNMPDKQVLFTVKESKEITFTIKLDAKYVDEKNSIDLKEDTKKLLNGIILSTKLMMNC